MYKDMVYLADLAKNFREAADVIDEIIEEKMTIQANGKETKRDRTHLQKLLEKYENILKREKEWG